MGQATSAPSKQAEPKPRLSKDEVELLEREFQKNPKPSSGRKREIAELLKVELPRINVRTSRHPDLAGFVVADHTAPQNWFQNRRAKEKQMKKTREFEAQQALERAASGSDSESPEEQDDSAVAEYYGAGDHEQACQVSSAAFPSDVSSNQQPVDIFIPEQNDSGLSSTTSDISPSDEDAQSLVQDEYPSPKSLPFHGTESGDMGVTPLANTFLPAQSHADFESQVTSPDGSVHDPLHPGQLGDFDAPHSVLTLGSFDFTTSMAADNIIAPVPSFPSQLLANEARCHQEFIKHEDAEGCALSIDEIASSSSVRHSPSSPPDMRFKSPPPPANLASRRNRGIPAQLNPTALRSYSYGPKTGIDMGRRPEAPSPMRRIASATGTMPGRIHKPSVGSAPRSPLYLERTKEALIRSLQAQGSTRSPVLGSINNALSPVTPSDCLPPSHQGMREATVSSSASDDEQRYTFGASQGAAAAAFLRLDSTLKTPPGTPGLGRAFQEQMITIDPAWNYVQQDEPLITPGLGSFGSEEFSMAPAAPGYVVQSQPPTPSFAPGIGPTYFPWGLNGAPAANAEYTFPNEPYMAPDVSTKSSPTQAKSKQFQFTQNITPQDFSVEK